MTPSDSSIANDSAPSPAPFGSWLADYVRGDQEAFTLLVRRTTPLVLAAALRRCGGRYDLAEEAAQIVFVDLARRAPSLRGDATLTGWLHQRATRAAADIMKRETRRAIREQQAALPELPFSLTAPAAPSPWGDCREQIDEALSRLNPTERTGVLLRCAEGLDFEAVGKSLGCSSEAARKKVTRALEKVRAFLAKHRTAVSVAVIAQGLAADQASAATLSAENGAGSLANLLAGNALATAGKITLLARALPWIKAVAAGTGAAAALWAWPIVSQLQPPATTSGVTGPVDAPGADKVLPVFPAVTAQLVPVSGLSFDAVVQRIAVMAEGTKLPDSWQQFQFYKQQIPAANSAKALRKLRTVLSPQGWHNLLSRDWAEDWITYWAAYDGPGAVNFILTESAGAEFKDAGGTLTSTLMGNLLYRAFPAALGLGYLPERPVITPQQGVALVNTVTAWLKPTADGKWTSAQRVLISRGTDLVRSVMADGNAEAMGLLVDLVNVHGFDWLDNSADDLKTKESLAAMLGHLPRLESPARRSALQLSILARLSELDLPSAIKAVETVTDPALRWTWASKVAGPQHLTSSKTGPVVQHSLKSHVEWWLSQAPPGKEADCLKQVTRRWMTIDPDWAVTWAAGYFRREEVLEFLRGVVKGGALSYRPSSGDSDLRFRRDVEVLRKFDPDGTPAFFEWLIEDNKKWGSVEKLQKFLLP